ncbi:hypothetical protein LINPERHAP2_LOCUS42627 [Linum perenne]
MFFSHYVVEAQASNLKAAWSSTISLLYEYYL